MSTGLFTIEMLKESDLPLALSIVDEAFADTARWLLGKTPAGRSEGTRVAERFYRPNAPVVGLRSEQGRLEGVCFFQAQGTRGAGGPLAVRPAYDTRIASRAALTASALSAMKLGVKSIDSVTFPQSPTHLTLYFNLSEPLFPSAFLSKNVSKRVPQTTVRSGGGGATDIDVVAFSTLDPAEQERVLTATRAVTGGFTAGFHLVDDLRYVQNRKLGETWIARARDGEHVIGFMVCHFGERSEAFADDQYLIKHLYVSTAPAQAQIEGLTPRAPSVIFETLLQHAERDALERGFRAVALMASSGRRSMMKFLLDRSYACLEVFSQWAARLPEQGQPVRCVGHDLASVQPDQFGVTELR